MLRTGLLAAAAISMALVACSQGQGTGEPGPYGGGPVAATTATSALPSCNCPSVADACDSGAAGPFAAPAAPLSSDGSAASTPPTGDAGATTGDGSADPVGLLLLVGGAARSDPHPLLCASGFSCQAYQSFPTCIAQGALGPPTCQTNAECIAAGMPAALCVAVGVDIAGAVSIPVPVCLQLCNTP